MTPLQIKIYDRAEKLPETWDDVAASNIFLTRNYLQVLELSAPLNMTCHFIGIFDGPRLCGVAISQFLNLNKLETFGERDKGIKNLARNFIFKRFSAHVLIIGNNMLTGQNAFSCLPQYKHSDILHALPAAAAALKKTFAGKGTPVHLVTYKDFDTQDDVAFNTAAFTKYYKFTTQPNMVFTIGGQWSDIAGYVAALSKKYRDQYKRAQKKSAGVVKVKMSIDDIISHQHTINKLYLHVARNAPFNTFFLAENHFTVMKQNLRDKFLFYGYFVDGQLIGFNTLIKNDDVLDTYFLGYDDAIQRERMLYLNMLYDMIGYAIKKKYSKIVFARTALEIKSSVGAQPEQMFGLMQHQNIFIQRRIAQIFKYLEPETDWQRRHPFKE